jgi:hypothetical protein
MTDSDHRETQPLSSELASALRRSTTQTITALLSLRIAVRDHVHIERAQGATLGEIDGGLAEMIDIAGGEPGDTAHSAERVDELKTQVLKWSEAFYSRRA